jgi:hypothetical protein
VSILNFPSKAAAVRAIRQEIAQHPLDAPFQSDLLQQLVFNHHPVLAGGDEIPSWFLKGSENPYGSTSYYFQGFFEARDIWWGVSWKDCVDPPTLKKRVEKCFRDYISVSLIWYRMQNSECELCGDIAVDTDHANIGGFNFIFRQVYQFNPPSMWEWYFENYYDFWSEKNRWIPESDPSIRYLKEIHEDGTIKLQSLCKPCHIEITRLRKAGLA